MWHVALRHTKVVEELAAFQATVSSATESVLGRSLGNTAHAEMVNELVAEFQKLEMRRLKLERPVAWILDLLLGPPPSRAWLANHLDEATAWLKVEQATRWEAEAELEDLWSLAVRVQDLVLDDVGGSSLMAASMSAVMEHLEGWIDVVAANGVRWGSCSTLVATVSHFPELDTDLEVLGSRHDAGLIEDDVNALCSWVCATADSLASHIPSSVAHNPLDSTGE
jgi:hypothetical protein